MSKATTDEVIGRNGVVITKKTTDGAGFRTYEVHQRERVGESTEKIKPQELISDEYREDPYPVLETLRENYPFYRNWNSNNYWVTRYNDVTSIFADEANFESRTNAWRYGLYDLGRDFGDHIDVLRVEERQTDLMAESLANNLAEALSELDHPDLVQDFSGPFAAKLLSTLFGVPEEREEDFTRSYWAMHRGANWSPQLQEEGRRAIQRLIELFEPLIAARRGEPREDIVSAMLEADESVTSSDVVATLLERDFETLHGALANLWYLLMTHPDEFEKAKSDARLMKLAYLETIRHSTPTLSAERFARHEVERFGKLIPQGALLICSAAAANRDPRIFSDPARFIVDRKDICQREPRGQYRADGLASGIAFGLGKPSIHPAVPEDRPRSRYALTRDTVVTASMALVETIPHLSLVEGAEPKLASLTVGEMHTCWSLPVVL